MVTEKMENIAATVVCGGLQREEEEEEDDGEIYKTPKRWAFFTKAVLLYITYFIYIVFHIVIIILHLGLLILY